MSIFSLKLNRFCFALFMGILLSPVLLSAQGKLRSGNAALQSGPMLGYAEMREVMIWVQANTEAMVSINYWEVENPDKKYTTKTIATNPTTGNTAKCIADQVQPGRSYQYDVIINGAAVKLPYPTTFKSQSLWRWRTDPPAFSVATGSCAYINEPEYDRPGVPYGSDYQIFGNIAAQKPDLMVWLGDNTYLREADWFTRTGIVHRYTHSRSVPELQSLLAATNHYAIWDDHDYGPNDSDGTWVHKEMVANIFENFWGNPTYGIPGQKGCATAFQYNDVDFFLLDNRYYRTPNYCETCPRTSLGKEQLEWFLASLAASTAPFKLVAIGGQMVTTSTNGETYGHFYPAERDTILARIARENIKGVVFLTGDKHYTELTRMKNPAGNWVYDLTTSAFTSGSFKDAATKDPNQLRVEGTVVDSHNFSMLRFSGPRRERQLEISVYDADGALKWVRTILPNGDLKQ
jgi:alkaline phosphatase D